MTQNSTERLLQPPAQQQGRIRRDLSLWLNIWSANPVIQRIEAQFEDLSTQRVLSVFKYQQKYSSPEVHLLQRSPCRSSPGKLNAQTGASLKTVWATVMEVWRSRALPSMSFIPEGSAKLQTPERTPKKHPRSISAWQRSPNLITEYHSDAGSHLVVWAWTLPPHYLNESHLIVYLPLSLPLLL